MSAELAIGVLGEAWIRFGGFPEARRAEIALWCLRRHQEIQSGHASGQTPKSVVHVGRVPSAQSQWYRPAQLVEREPGCDDE